MISISHQFESHPFTTADHNCQIRRIQPRDKNPHAVFLVTESEALTYHYELELREQFLRPDPRITHALTLSTNKYGQPLQTVAVGYPRVRPFQDADPTPTFPARLEVLAREVQNELHLAYTETHYTNDVNEEDHYRLRVPCEVSTFELTGIRPDDEGDRDTTDSWDDVYFTLDELRAYRLSDAYQDSGVPVASIPYHQLPDRLTPQKRIVEQVRTLYFSSNLVEPLPYGELNHLGLLYETYKLALTGEILTTVFGGKLTPPVQAALSDNRASGYLSGHDLERRFAPEPASNFTGQYWIRSGIAGFADDAAEHFYLPERYTDPFEQATTLAYDDRDLFVQSSTDPLGNTIEITQFDFRVLAPSEIKDINNNLSEVYFNALGMPAAVAVKGKGDEADSLAGFDDALANPENETLIQYFTGDNYAEGEARRLLDNATMRYVYFFGEEVTDGTTVWGRHAASACTILREKHVAQLGQNEQSRLQAAFEYTDGLGAVFVKKIQAEPEEPNGPLRWIASGKTILNNKGKPVKQYEPYFSETEHRFDEAEAQRETGVTPIMYYDAPGRLIRTELPDGSFSHVEFSPWHVRTFDQNDTVMESTWYSDRNPPNPEEPLPRNPITGELLVTQDQRAAWLASHHANTPAETHLDSLGREVIVTACNRVEDPQGTIVLGGKRYRDARYLTFTKLDAEGKPLWIRDSRGNRVMQYITPPVPGGQVEDPSGGYAPCYDIAGNLLFQHSMDAGDRWVLNDAAGKPLYAWDSRDHVFRTAYDALHRPTHLYVRRGNNVEVLVERTVYGETVDQAAETNHRGRVYQHSDQAGLVTNMGRNPVTNLNEAYDFKGNLLRSSRQLAVEYKNTLDWLVEVALEEPAFASSTTYDALNRPVTLTTPDGSVIRPEFNEANLLNAVRANLRGAQAETEFVRNIDYNAKGQRELIEYGNGVATGYEYDKETFRLNHLQTVRSETTLQDLSYTYDPVGNITHIQDDADIQNTIYFRNQRVEPSADYEYDAIYRLIKATGREHLGQSGNGSLNRPVQPSATDAPRVGLAHPGDGNAMGNYTERYDYDAVGNILRMIHQAGQVGGWTRRYAYAADNNRLLATSLPSDEPLDDYSAIYTYDAHGNMTSMPHLTAMEWDFKDQLHVTQQQVVNDGVGERTYYVYDAAGQRVRKVTETAAQNGNAPRRKEESIYLGGFEVYRKYNGDGATVTLERETLHIMDDKQRIALVETRTLDTAGNDPAPQQLIRYQLGNHLGSASLELDDQAQVISYEEYTPYGSTSYQAVRSGVEVSRKRYRYTGMERDEESGLNYHGARYYAPWLGRWNSPDPLLLSQGKANNLLSLINPYSYANNMPIVATDPLGLSVVVEGFQGDMRVQRGGRTQTLHLRVRQSDAILMFKRDFEAGLPSTERGFFSIDPTSGQLQLSQAYHQAVREGRLGLLTNAQRWVEAIQSQSAIVVRPLSVFSHRQIRERDLSLLGPDAAGVMMRFNVRSTATGQPGTLDMRFAVSGDMGAPEGAQGITLLERSINQRLGAGNERWSSRDQRSEVYYLSYLYSQQHFTMNPDIARVVGESVQPGPPTPQEAQRPVSKTLYHEVIGHVVEALRGRASPDMSRAERQRLRGLRSMPPGFERILQEIESEVERNIPIRNFRGMTPGP
jgi:RHS repeat-associated protein